MSCMFVQVFPPSVDLNMEVSCVYGVGLCWMAGVTKPVGPEIQMAPEGSVMMEGSLTPTVPSSTVVTLPKASGGGRTPPISTVGSGVTWVPEQPARVARARSPNGRRTWMRMRYRFGHKGGPTWALWTPRFHDSS